MTRSIAALVEPEMLIWGRETIGLSWDLAAKKIGISLERLVEWESGTKRPTIAQLRKAANVYKRPVTAFYLPKPPEEPVLPHDYRRLDQKERLEYSPALRLELRLARYRRQVALELLAEMGGDVPELWATAYIDDDPDDLAEIVREVLDISVEEQFDWLSKYDALRSWKSAIEALGVLVFQTGTTVDRRIPVGDMRGVSIAEAPLPIILLNSADSVRARIFTLIHEFIHLLLRDGGVCDYDVEDYRRPFTSEKQTEIFCNRVAGATLVPATDLMARDIVVRKGSRKNWSDGELTRLANQFQVSKEVILRRLLIIGKTTRAFYAERRAALHKQAIQKAPRKPGGGGPPPYRTIMGSNGLAYTRLVIDAYYEGVVTDSKVSDYLGMKLKHLKRIEETLMQMV